MVFSITDIVPVQLFYIIEFRIATCTLSIVIPEGFVPPLGFLRTTQKAAMMKGKKPTNFRLFSKAISHQRAKRIFCSLMQETLVRTKLTRRNSSKFMMHALCSARLGSAKTHVTHRNGLKQPQAAATAKRKLFMTVRVYKLRSLFFHLVDSLSLFASFRFLIRLDFGVGRSICDFPRRGRRVLDVATNLAFSRTCSANDSPN